ncbi:MAG: Pnap_2097 family protein [Pseudomonadota bacterium]
MNTAIRATDLAEATCAAVVMQDRIRLGMAQLSPFGLSEDWVLKTCGDRHWTLIAQASGNETIAFFDPEGRPLYAAFCATALRLHAPENHGLGETLHVFSSLHAVGNCKLGSRHVFRVGARALGHLTMISTFLRHDDSGSNHRLTKSRLPGLRPLPQADDALRRLDAQARLKSRQRHAAVELTEPLVRVTPSPALDFNAVGLLYFASYTRVADAAIPRSSANVARDIVYFGNVDMGEEIQVFGDECDLRLVSGSGKLLASVETR